MDKYDALKLENQMCFPLYAASREVIKQYRPFLEALDLTYTQYITMMVLWERHALTAKELGECLYLDSGTLTPLLKKMEEKGYVNRRRCEQDERVVRVYLTEQGRELQNKVLDIPEKVGGCVPLSAEESGTLYQLLYKILA